MQRLFFAILTVCFATAALAQTQGGTPGTDTPKTDAPLPSGSTSAIRSNDEQFIKTMATGGLMEVEAGKLASARATHPEVKKFGQTMVSDHSKSNEKLKALAATRKFDLPTALDGEKKAEKTKLEAQSGPAFDAAYMDAMVKAHRKTVSLLQQQINTGKDATIKRFAEETLPTVKRHLEMAQQLQAKVSRADEPRAAR